MLPEYCSKFKPNIFNPSKCSTCFKLLEEHSAVITGDHATKRKVVKCGYLFIAPFNLDFTSSVQKTKRWQRRWFVLYDDGELTWSLDEQPDTIPQGTLDMTMVMDVKNAESLTDNQYSLCLSLLTNNSKGSSSVFIKGTSNEEIRSWELKFKNILLSTPSVHSPSSASSIVSLADHQQQQESHHHHHHRSQTISPCSNNSSIKSNKSSSPSPSSTSSLTSTPNSNNNKRRMTIGGMIPPSLSTSSGTSTLSASSSLSSSTLGLCENKTMSNNSSSSIGSIMSSNNSCNSMPLSSNNSVNKSSLSSLSSSSSTRFLSDLSLMSPRGDPDGCGEKSIDHGPLRKGWLLKYTSTSNNSDATPLQQKQQQHEENNYWSKFWFVLRNSKLLYFTNADEEECLGSLTLDINTTIETIESMDRHYGFYVQNWSLAAITNGMRGIWIKSLETARKTTILTEEETISIHQSPPTPTSPQTQTQLKTSATTSASSPLPHQTTTILSPTLPSSSASSPTSSVSSSSMTMTQKSSCSSISNHSNSNNSSSTAAVETKDVLLESNNTGSSVVLSPLLKSKKSLKWRKKAVIELKEEFSKFSNNNNNNSITSNVNNGGISNNNTNGNNSSSGGNCVINASSNYALQDTSIVDEIVELRNKVRQLENEIDSMSQERMILSLRLNDFTEKLYQSEKLNKQLRLKVSRVKGQSLKDKQTEIELLNKISVLEDEIKHFNFSAAGCSAAGGGGGGGDTTLGNEMNCGKCSMLEEVIKDREVKLSELENCIGDMELQFHRKIQELRDFITRPNSNECHEVRVKYQREVGELKNLCTKGLEALENSHRRMITELEEKHRREIQSLQIEKETALQEETNATLAALDALRKNHDLELQREMNRFKEEFIRKFQDGQDLTALHKEHEEELAEIKNEILLLSDKYSSKCLETSKLEENIEHLNNLLLEAKRRILEVEGAGFLGVLCYSMDNNNDKSTNENESTSKSSDYPSQRKSILRSTNSPSFQKLSTAN